MVDLRRLGLAVREFVGEVVGSIARNRMTDLAAQLAYWALLALFPFVIFLLTVLGYLPLEGMDRVLLREIYRAMPREAASLIEHTIHEVIGRQRGWLLVAALFGTVWSGSRSVGGIIGALNHAHDVRETRSFWHLKGLSILVTLSFALLVIVATAALMIGPGIVKAVWAFFGLPGRFHIVWAWIRWPISTLTSLFALASIYHFLPNVRRPFRLVSPGSVTAFLLWVAVSLLFRLYVSRFHAFARTYGTLGTAVVLMTWLHLSGLVVLLGSEIDAALARLARSSPVRPEPK